MLQLFRRFLSICRRSSHRRWLAVALGLSVFWLILWKIVLTTLRTLPVGMSACDDGGIYCLGNILHAVELSGIFSDSKTYVDRPLKAPAQQVLAEFDKLGPWPNITQDQLRDFIDRYFAPAGSDLHEIIPPDYKTVQEGGLPVYHQIKDVKLRDFAEQVHSRWRDLGREVNKDVTKNPDQHSIIPLPFPFIVPGGRFREVYYWDSFWTIQGLLVSGMTETAKGMLLNFGHLIDKYGHIPNGNRIYYMKRSEPPVFALMIDHFIKHKNVAPRDADYVVTKLLPALEKEYQFWMRERAVSVTVKGQTFTMNRYTGGSLTTPRPESYYEDYYDAQELRNKSVQSVNSFYGNIAAAAESGLDFSTRWLEGPEANFLTIRTQTILPVDLNALLCASENILSDLFQLSGDLEKSERYRQLGVKRGDGVHAIFWNSSKLMWHDYDMKRNQQRETFYLSGIVPLFARCSGSQVDVTSSQFITTLLTSTDLQSDLVFPGGFPVSFVQAAGRYLQWDFPNAWPPLQLMLIEGFNANPEFADLARQWAQKWVSAVYTGYVNTSHIYEKYDARVVGAYGSGGEYVVQEGFGWTNGGVLRLLELFPSDLQAPCCTFTPAGPAADPSQSA